jgi:hypothetical protein
MAEIEAGPEPTILFRPSALFGAMVASRRLRYVYVQNCKCASSTVRATLWAAEHGLGLAGPPGAPHRMVDGVPFVDDPRRWEHVEDEFVFTIVRNPYVRVLSAYLDKIVRHRGPLAWGRFAAAHGLGDGPLAFGDFLRLVAATPEDQMDVHWRPQSCCLAPSVVPYDFIGSMETFQADIAHVLHRIFGDRVPLRDIVHHRTGSSGQLAQHYGSEEIRLVRQIYAADFANLGYSTDPTVLTRRDTSRRADPEAIRSWGRAWRLASEREFDAAAAELEALRPSLAGPPLEERLARCRCELPKDRVGSALAANVSALEVALDRGYGDWATWRWYGRALSALGRHEDGMEAEILALESSRPPKEAGRRLRRLRWRLALLRASKGRRAAALAVLARQERVGEKSHGWKTTLLHRIRRATIYGISALARVIRASHWHPDRALGIPGPSS